MSRRYVLPFLVLVATVAILLAADWWVGVPEGKPAEYVGRGECARCHEKEVEAWTGSDHDRAMDPATPETVLGNFDGEEFTHVAFADLDRLSDEELLTLLQSTADLPWALALRSAKAEIKSRVLGAMPERRLAREIEEAMGEKEVIRPADTIAARDQITQAVRDLKAAGRVSVAFAATSEFFRDGEKFFVVTDGPAGKKERFPIKYVFGYRPLQQYLIEFPDGRVQCLGIAWDTERKRWFHLYPGQQIPAGDELHWTAPSQNWNYMCAECHSTNLQKKFDLETNSYHTTFSEIDVSCETCHGPGSLHVELADSIGPFKWDRRLGYALPKLKSKDPHVEIETCAPCHARRRVVHPGHRAGQKLLDYYVPELLDGNLYYADGQILEEDYVYGSFIQSKMYAKGVRCTDCHDPHSMRIKFSDSKAPWWKITNNRVCTECHMGTHPAAKYDTPAHHHHPDASKPGTLCVECHMPETPYMVVDPRRDHSIRNPRPDLTVGLKIPNACNGCHHDRSKGETPEWAQKWVRQWYGKPKGPRHFAYAIDAGRKRTAAGALALGALIRRKDVSGMVRASAVVLLGNYPNRTGHAAVFRGLKSPDPLVREAALRGIQFLPEALLRRRAAPLLDDPIRAVRSEAARVVSRVAGESLSRDEKKAFDAALAEYLTGQKSLSDRAAAHMNMGVVYANLRQIGKAVEAYRTAIRVDPTFPPAHINLATLYAGQGDRAGAEQQFREAIEIGRKRLGNARARETGIEDAEGLLGEIHYSLGLLLAEVPERLEDAAAELAEAVQLIPNADRIHYNYGLALQHLDMPDEAEEELKAAYRLASGRLDYLQALLILYSQQQRPASAVALVEDYVRRHPGDRQMQMLLERIRREAAALKEPE